MDTFSHDLNESMMFKGQHPEYTVVVSLESDFAIFDSFWNNPSIIKLLVNKSIVVRLSEAQNPSEAQQFCTLFNVTTIPSIHLFPPHQTKVAKTWSGTTPSVAEFTFYFNENQPNNNNNNNLNSQPSQHPRPPIQVMPPSLSYLTQKNSNDNNNNNNNINNNSKANSLNTLNDNNSSNNNKSEIDSLNDQPHIVETTNMKLNNNNNNKNSINKNFNNINNNNNIDNENNDGFKNKRNFNIKTSEEIDGKEETNIFPISPPGQMEPQPRPRPRSPPSPQAKPLILQHRAATQNPVSSQTDPTSSTQVNQTIQTNSANIATRCTNEGKPKTAKISVQGLSKTVRREFPSDATVRDLRLWVRTEFGRDLDLIVAHTHEALPGGYDTGNNDNSEGAQMTLLQADLCPSAFLRERDGGSVLRDDPEMLLLNEQQQLIDGSRNRSNVNNAENLERNRRFNINSTLNNNINDDIINNNNNNINVNDNNNIVSLSPQFGGNNRNVNMNVNLSRFVLFWRKIKKYTKFVFEVMINPWADDNDDVDFSGIDANVENREGNEFEWEYAPNRNFFRNLAASRSVGGQNLDNTFRPSRL